MGGPQSLVYFCSWGYDRACNKAAQGGTFLIRSHTHVLAQCNQVTSILSRIGDKWSVIVVALLGDGPMRFNELRRTISGISQRMLTLTLRGLERDGFLTRTVFPTIPPRVNYELTPLGVSLLEPVRAMGLWAIANAAAIEEARRRFDSRPPAQLYPAVEADMDSASPELTA
jgi:DNA-binding HxlR family transcriptional regulator